MKTLTESKWIAISKTINAMLSHRIKASKETIDSFKAKIAKVDHLGISLIISNYGDEVMKAQVTLKYYQNDYDAYCNFPEEYYQYLRSDLQKMMKRFINNFDGVIYSKHCSQGELDANLKASRDYLNEMSDILLFIEEELTK